MSAVCGSYSFRLDWGGGSGFEGREHSLRSELISCEFLLHHVCGSHLLKANL